MELDFIKEEILSIEDFDNVDESLMQEINKKEEYRELFEELKEISALCKEIPMPEKDGVSLHDATLARVKSGDTAPRYINAGQRRFPFATAACLVLCFVVVLAARTFVDKKGNFDAAESETNLMMLADYKYSSDVADQEAVEEAEEENAAFRNGSVKFGASKNKGTASGESVSETAQSQTTSDDTGVAYDGSDAISGGGGAVCTDAYDPGNAVPEEQESTEAESDTDSTAPEAAAKAETETYCANDVLRDTVNTTVGGGFNGEFFELRYVGSVDGVVFEKNTFTADCSDIIDDIYIPLYEKHRKAGTENELLPVLYYVVQNLSVTRDDIKVYFAARGVENVNERVVEGLLSKNENEAMQLLKSPYAFYADGKVYTAEEVFYMYLEGTLGFDINDEAYDEVWKCCYEAQNSAEGTTEWSEDFPGFVEENYRRSLGE